MARLRQGDEFAGRAVYRRGDRRDVADPYTRYGQSFLLAAQFLLLAPHWHSNFVTLDWGRPLCAANDAIAMFNESAIS